MVQHLDLREHQEWVGPQGKVGLTAKPQMKGAGSDHQTACSDVTSLRSSWEVKLARRGQDWHGARPSTS